MIQSCKVRLKTFPKSLCLYVVVTHALARDQDHATLHSTRGKAKANGDSVVALTENIAQPIYIYIFMLLLFGGDSDSNRTYKKESNSQFARTVAYDN